MSLNILNCTSVVLFLSIALISNTQADDTLRIIGIYRGMQAQIKICSIRYPDHKTSLEKKFQTWSKDGNQQAAENAYSILVEEVKKTKNPQASMIDSLYLVHAIEDSLSVDAFEVPSALHGLCKELATTNALIEGPYADLNNLEASIHEEKAIK